MTDWADGIETRNYGIRNEINVHMLSDLMCILFSLALVAGALLFYSWVRNQIVHTGYESQSLFAAEESLLRVQERLALEEETLCHPERIDIIARNDLGMAPLHPSQIILPRLDDAVDRASGEMAMMDSRAVGLKKIVAIKRPGNFSD